MVFINEILDLIKTHFDPKKFVADLKTSVAPILAQLVNEKFIEIMTKIQKEFDPAVFLGEIRQQATPLVGELIEERIKQLEQKLQAQIFELLQDLSDRVRIWLLTERIFDRIILLFLCPRIVCRSNLRNHMQLIND